MLARRLVLASLIAPEREARTDSAAGAGIGRAPPKQAFSSCGWMWKERYDLQAVDGKLRNIYGVVGVGSSTLGLLLYMYVFLSRFFSQQEQESSF